MAADDWPHTTRLLPWLLAVFLGTLFLLPFDSTQLDVPFPVDPQLDRIVLVGIAVVWLIAFAAGGRGSPRFRSSAFNLALLAFVLVALASVLAHGPTLARLEELEPSLKKLATVASLAGVFFLVTTVVRPSEVRAFAVLIVGLACLTALGTVIEYRGGFNAFYTWGAAILPGTVTPEDVAPDGYRPLNSGPTAHPIANATLLAMALPFALVGVLGSRREQRRWWLYAAATAIICAGAVSSFRRTGVVAPVAALVALFLYRPRGMARLLPLGLVVILVIQVGAPQALGGVKSQLLTNDDSKQGRTDDYEAIVPDVESRPTLGRGFGSYDPYKYRFLDNEYLGRVVETGYIGLLTYLGLILTAGWVAHRAFRTAAPTRAGPALAAVAATAAFGVSSALFDALAFPQGAYLLFIIAGFAVSLAASGREGAMSALREPAVATNGNAAARRPQMAARPARLGPHRPSSGHLAEAPVPSRRTRTDAPRVGVRDPAYYQRERYLEGRERPSYAALWPLLPRSLRLRVQRAYAPKQARRRFPAWPIEPVLVDWEEGEVHRRLRASGRDRLPVVNLWPEHRSFAFIVTHDVDGPPDMGNVGRILDLERRHGVVSSWNFVAEDYDIPAGIFDEIVAGGGEIGLRGVHRHDNLFQNRSTFDAKLPKIQGYLERWNAVGFRSPASRRNAEWIAELGCLYDSSYPDTDPFGVQPGGCCAIFPFLLGDVVELPITLASDRTLFEVLQKRSINIWTCKSEWIIRHHGMVNVATHPDCLADSEQLAMYGELLAFLNEQEGGWHALPRDVAAWWAAREAMWCELSEDGSARIAGASDPRARLAWARELDGRVVFEH